MENEQLDREVRMAVYAHFITSGEAPSVQTLAASLRHAEDDVSRALHRLADSRILVLRAESDEIWMAMPFSALPTPFRVRAATGEWWANCAWDALGVAATTHQDVSIHAHCATDGNPVPLTVRDGVLNGTGFVHFAIPAARWWDDIGFT